jgi:hypothetical protein
MKITVSEANLAPVISTISLKNVDERQLLQFLVPINDLNLPVQPLQFTLFNTPAGMTVSSVGLVN